MVEVPRFVANNARRGLDLLEFKGSGLRPKTVREAREMASGSVSADKVRRMAAWFARHTPDLSSPDARAYASGQAERPTPGQVAWLLWGGGLGEDKLDAMKWAERTRDRLIREGELSKASPKEIRVGASVQYAVPKPPQPTEYATGIVTRVSSDGSLTVGGESRDGSPEDPAVIVKVYARTEDGQLMLTDRRVVRLASELRVIEDITPRIRKQVPQAVEARLRDLVQEHNTKHPEAGKRVTFSMLEQVYRRGIGAYRSNPGSVRPTVASAEQWAYGRVNAFLVGVRSGRFPRTPFDRDLLPEGHPLSTRKSVGEFSGRSDRSSSDDATILANRRDDGGSVARDVEKAVTKREGGEDFPAQAFAYVPDPEAPSTWKLRLWDSLDARETAAQVGRAVAALGPGGFRGNRVEIPSEDLARVKERVLVAWLKANPEMAQSDAPSVLKQGDVRRSLPISYRPNSQASVPAFKPSCGTCEYACLEIDEETGEAVLMCEKWEAPVQASFYCDAWEICEERAPEWLSNDDEEHGMTSEIEDSMEPYEMALEGSDLPDALRTLLANTVAFYLQTHGAHWNVRGSDFSQYHDLFASIYEDALEAIDPTAELIRKLGGDAPSYISEIVDLATITEAPVTFTPQDLASAVLMSNDQVLEQLRAVFTIANEQDEQGVANFVAERIDSHQKWSWQLRASLSGSLPEPSEAPEAPSLPQVVLRSIREENGQFCVYSESGRSFGCYTDPVMAQERLSQIEQFSASLMTKSVQEIVETHNATHRMEKIDDATKTIHDLLEDHLEVICGLAQPYEFSIEDKLAMVGKPNHGWISKSVEHRYTLGPAYVPNVEDAHGEWTDPETLQKAMWEWVRKEDRTIYLQHSEKPAGEMVEMLTWPFPIDAELTVPNQGVSKFTFPADTPFLGVVWEPWAWDLVKAGKLRGYSIGGQAQRIEADLPVA